MAKEPTEPQKPKEHPSTYFVQDRSNEEELTRLRIQDQFITSEMGGVLAEQDNPTRFQRVLDVGCGTGDWLITVAQQLPNATLLVGVDVSLRMVQYARSQAQAVGIADRVEFHAGTREGQLFAEDIKHAFKTMVPFLRKWTTVPKDYDSIYQEALREMQQPGFVASWPLLTCWGTNPDTPEKQVFDPH